MSVCARRKVQGRATYEQRATYRQNSLPRQGAVHREGTGLLNASWTGCFTLAGFPRTNISVRVPTGNRVRRTAGEGVAGEERLVRPAPSMCLRVVPQSGLCAPRKQGRLSSGNDWPRHGRKAKRCSERCDGLQRKGPPQFGLGRSFARSTPQMLCLTEYS
jgi:hypothetical protein